MKKILSLLLCAIMIIPAFGMQSASAKEMLFAGDYDKAVSILSHIGIVGDFNTENGGNAYDLVSRAKFAEMVAKALKIKNSTDTIYFSDVKTDHRAYTYINALVENNIVSLASDNLFNPDSIITYEQAAKILVRAMGYGVYAEGNGGYPTGYIKTANSLKLTNGAEISGNIKYADAVILLFNAMNTGIFDIKSVSNGSVDYKQSDDTLLSINWDIYEDEGCLTEYYGGSMDSDLLAKDEVKIGGTLYKIPSSINPKPYFTNYVEFLYEEKDGKDTLIYIENDKSQNKGTIIDSEQYVSFSGASNTITYYRDSEKSASTSTASFSRSAKIIFNGMPYGGSLNRLFAEYFDNESHRGTIHIKDYGSESRSLVVIEAYRAFTVGHLDSDGKIYNKYNNTDIIDIDSCDYVNFYDGNSIIENNAAADNVYMAAVSADKKAVSLIYYRTPDVKGKVTSVSNDGTIRVEDKEYKIDTSILSAITMPKYGSECEVYADEFGYAIYISETQNAKGLRLAYLMDYAKNTSSLGDRPFKLKLLDRDNKIITVEASGKITVDGIKRESEDIAANPTNFFPDVKLSDGKYTVGRQVIRYRTDSEGLLKEIDTSITTDKEKADEGYTLTKYPDNVYENILPGVEKNRKQLRRISQGGKVINRLDSNIIFTEKDSIMFNIPLTDSEGYLMHESGYFNREGTYLTDQDYIYDGNGNKIKADDDMYSVGYKALSVIYSYFIDAYDCNKDMPYAECVVYSYQIVERMKNLQLVTGFTQAFDSKENDSTFIKLMNGSTEKAYPIDNALLTSTDSNGNTVTIGEGDIVIADCDSSTDRIYNLTKVYDMKTNKIIPYPFNGTNAYENWAGGGYVASYIRYHEARQMTKGNVLKRVGTVLYVDWNGDFVYDEIIESAGAPIIVHEKTKQRDGRYVREGTLADINDFESSGDDYSEILCSLDYGTAVNIFVYK